LEWCDQEGLAAVALSEGRFLAANCQVQGRGVSEGVLTNDYQCKMSVGINLRVKPMSFKGGPEYEDKW